MKSIRLFLVEDDQLLREGIIEILKYQRDITVVAASSNKENAALSIHKLKPNVVLMDLGLRNATSLEIVRMVRKEFPLAKVIVMDLAPAPADLALFVKAGASGFILREITVEQFLQTIRSVAKGDKALPTLLPESLFMQIVDYAIIARRAVEAAKNKTSQAAKRSVAPTSTRKQMKTVGKKSTKRTATTTKVKKRTK